jgi:RHS repeat-associated protein
MWFPRDPTGGSSACSAPPTATATATTCSTGSGRSSPPPTCPAASSTATPTSPYGEQINPRAGDTNPWRYVSGYHDTTTGLIKFGARYYMPDLACWTQTDPVMGNPNNPMTLNGYGYVGGDPINAVDPDGRHIVQVLDTVKMAVSPIVAFGLADCSVRAWPHRRAWRCARLRFRNRVCCRRALDIDRKHRWIVFGLHADEGVLDLVRPVSGSLESLSVNARR